MGMEENKLNDDELENVSGGCYYFCVHENMYYVMDRSGKLIGEFSTSNDLVSIFGWAEMYDLDYETWYKYYLGHQENGSLVPDNGGNGSNGSICPK